MAFFSVSGKGYKKAYDTVLGNTTPCSQTANLASNVVLLGLCVIGCLAAANVFPHAYLGWTSIGMGGGYLCVKLMGANLCKRKVDLVYSAFIAAPLLAIGTLGVLSILPPVYISYVFMGYLGLITCISSCLMVATKSIYEKQKNVELKTKTQANGLNASE